MSELFRNGIILLMIGANFTCLYIIFGFWLRSLLPDREIMKRFLKLVIFCAAVLLTHWAMVGQQSLDAHASGEGRATLGSDEAGDHVDYPAL